MEGIWQNWAESPPLDLQEACRGLEFQSQEEISMFRCRQMRKYNWTEKLCLWFLTSSISILHLKLKVIPWGFSSGSSLHASFMKVRSWTRLTASAHLGADLPLMPLPHPVVGRLFGLHSQSFATSSYTANAKSPACLPLLWQWLISLQNLSLFHTGLRSNAPNSFMQNKILRG